MLASERGHDVASHRRRWIVLVALCIGQLMIVLDATAVFVALPVIQRELHFSQASLAWVINAYLLTFGGLLLLGGRLGDLIGRKQVLLTGLGIFAFSSLLCGLSSSSGVLVAARFLQGAGAAAISAMVLAIISPMFPEPRERTRAFSIYAFAASGGASLGLTLGGIVTEFFSWHWIFFINVPIGIGALVLTSRLLEPHRGLGLREGADVLGALLVTGAPMLVVYGLINAGSSSWTSPPTVVALLGSIALGAALVAVESRAAIPLIPLRVFRHRVLIAATILRVLFQIGGYGLAFLGPLYLEHVLGYGPLRTGLAFVPNSATISVVSLGLIPRLVRRVALRTLIVAGFVLLSAGLLLVSGVSPHTGFIEGILPSVLLGGAGYGLLYAPIVSIAMSDVAPSEAGVVSGMTNVAHQLGASIGVAALATVAAARTTSLLARHESPKMALTGGYRLGFMVAASFTVLGLVTALALLRPRRPSVASALTMTRPSGNGEIAPNIAPASLNRPGTGQSLCESRGGSPVVWAHGSNP